MSETTFEPVPAVEPAEPPAAAGTLVMKFGGTSVADQTGFLLNIHAAGGITDAASTGAYQAREASTKVIEDTLSWLRGTHSIQAGGSWTRTDVWLQNQQFVPVNDGEPICATKLFEDGKTKTLSAADQAKG